MMFRLLAYIVIAMGLTSVAQADVVKPALVEISVNTKGTVTIEVRASIEALLTGIDARYKNTQDAPTAEEYDQLRVVSPDRLQLEFEPFKAEFLEHLFLKADDVLVPLEIVDVSIPEPGYPKVPRISVIKLSCELDQSTTSLQWYYPARFGDNAVQVIDGGVPLLSTVTPADQSVLALRKRRLSPTQSVFFKVWGKGERLDPKPGRADHFEWPRIDPKPVVHVRAKPAVRRGRAPARDPNLPPLPVQRPE